VLEKIRGGDWSDETQEALRNGLAEFADDFGYDLDEEGHPIDDREVGETSREQEGIRSTSEGNGAGGEGADEEAADEEEAAAPA
jgi:F-type H+-transporting ATPase subunit alpha